MKKETSWGGVSEWYSNYLDTDNDSYHAKVILPNLMRLVDPKEGMNILDLACGEGYFARAFAKKGAHITGADVSTELIGLAKKKSPAKVSFHVTPSHDLSNIADARFDVITTVLAIQNIEKVKETFEEVSRVLAVGGRYILVLNHPAFRIPKKTSWGWDDVSSQQYRRVDSYMSESKTEIDMSPGSKDANITVSFHRPLQYYVKLLAKNDMVITRMEEWISHKESQKGPRQEEENRIRKEIPMFMMIEVRKI